MSDDLKFKQKYLDTKSASSNKDEPEKKEVSKNDSPIEESPKATTSSEADKS